MELQNTMHEILYTVRPKKAKKRQNRGDCGAETQTREGESTGNKSEHSGNEEDEPKELDQPTTTRPPFDTAPTENVSI